MCYCILFRYHSTLLNSCRALFYRAITKNSWCLGENWGCSGSHYLGLRSSGLTQVSEGMSSLAGRLMGPVSITGGHSSSLAGGWGEGLCPRYPWVGERQRRSIPKWRSSSPNMALRAEWFEFPSMLESKGCLPTSCPGSSSSSASTIKGSFGSGVKRDSGRP